MRSEKGIQCRNSTGKNVFACETVCLCDCYVTHSVLCCPFMCAPCFLFLRDCSPAVDVKASIGSQAVVVLCSRLPQTVLTPKLKDLQHRQASTLSDVGQDTTASLDDHTPSTTQSETDVQELEGKEREEDLHAQTVSSPSKRRLVHKRVQRSTCSISSPSKRRKRRVSDASSTGIPEQQDGGVQAKVTKSPLKGPKRPTAASGDPFICVLDSEEEGGEKKAEAAEMLQQGEDLDAVASICEVFEIP